MTFGLCMMVAQYLCYGVYGVVVCLACQGGRLGLRKGQDYYSGAQRCFAKGCGACCTGVPK
jgi:hypothetical protein